MGIKPRGHSTGTKPATNNFSVGDWGFCGIGVGGMVAKFGNADPAKPEFRKANGVQLKQLETKLNQMKKSWPDAKATDEAAKLAEKFLSK